jgi:hypothetical protein
VCDLVCSCTCSPPRPSLQGTCGCQRRRVSRARPIAKSECVMVIARAVHAGVVNVVCVCTHHCLMIAHDRRVCAHYCITHLPHPRYEKARRLCKKIPEIRKKYLKDLDDSDALVRAVCSCVWAYVIPNPPRHDSVRLLCGSSIAWHCASATRRARTRCARACTRACTNSYTAPPPPPG